MEWKGGAYVIVGCVIKREALVLGQKAAAHKYERKRIKCAVTRCRVGVMVEE